MIVALEGMGIKSQVLSRWWPWNKCDIVTWSESPSFTVGIVCDGWYMACVQHSITASLPWQVQISPADNTTLQFITVEIFYLSCMWLKYVSYQRVSAFTTSTILLWWLWLCFVFCIGRSPRRRTKMPTPWLAQMTVDEALNPCKNNVF